MFCNGFSGLPLVYFGRLNPTERGMFCLTFRQVIGAILKNFLKKCKGVIFELRFSDFKKSPINSWGKIWYFRGDPLRVCAFCWSDFSFWWQCVIHEHAVEVHFCVLPVDRAGFVW